MRYHIRIRHPAELGDDWTARGSLDVGMPYTYSDGSLAVFLDFDDEAYLPPDPRKLAEALLDAPSYLNALLTAIQREKEWRYIREFAEKSHLQRRLGWEYLRQLAEKLPETPEIVRQTSDND